MGSIMQNTIEAKAAEAAEQFAEHGYAIVREFIPPDLVRELQAETRRIYAEGLKHHATYRHGNLAFEILHACLPSIST